MNVVCVRCNTRYEFDDALVSSRGTSVKCTNCGHKFRVHPPGGRASLLPDQWVIRKQGGQGGSVRFETLRDLQRALNDGSVTIADEISRDGRSFRPIHAVPELESFFPRQGLKSHTLTGASQPQRPFEQSQPGADRAAPSGNEFEEDEATAVYSSEQLNKLHPGRPGAAAGKPRIPMPGSLGPPLARKGGPTKVSGAPSGRPGHAGAAPPAPVRVGRPSVSGAPGRTPAAPPPMLKRSLSGPAAGHKISPVPIVAPRASVALPGTPTISVTGPNTTDASLDFDTVRPPPGDPTRMATATPARPRSPLPSVPPEDVPTRVGKLESFATHTVLGMAAPPVPKGPASAASTAPTSSSRPAAPATATTPARITPVPPLSPTPPGGTGAVDPNAVTALNAVEVPGLAAARVPSSSDVVAPAAPDPGGKASALHPESVEGSDPGGLRRRGRRGAEASVEVPNLPGAGLPNVGSPDAAATASAFDALDQQPSLPPRPRSNLRWVFGLLLVAGVAGVALLLGREHLRPKPQTSSYEAELEVLLAAGHDLYRQGDLDGASSKFDKASGLSESDPRVLGATLLVETTRCDRSWLEVRLWPEGSPQATAAASALSACVPKLAALSDRALTASDGSPEFRAALLDGFRIRGELAHARARAGGLSEHLSVPVAAYALAMLDVADASPGWPTVIDRLRLASGAEQTPGRAHAALVYALVRSGDREAAREQLSQLEAAPRENPLVPALQAFVQAEAEPASSASAEPSGSDEAPPAEHAAAGDGVDPLEGARQARAKGDFSLAEHYYQLALQRDPANVAALTGLGDVARGRGNSAAALSHYHAALRANPQHLPAISGVADVNWANGDRAEAVKYYRRIGDGNVYSIRAQQRIAEFEARNHAAPEPSTGTAPSAKPEPEEPEAPTTAPDDEGAGHDDQHEAEPEPVPIPKAPPPSDEEPPEPKSQAPKIPGPAPKDDP